MSYQLIFKETEFKELIPFFRNIDGEYIGPAMFEAQEVGLKAILGTCLLSALQMNETAEDPDARLTDLKKQALFYLCYETAVRLAPKLAYKVGNIGVFQTTDEKIQPLSKVDIDSLISDYQSMADHFCYELQLWVLQHSREYPELGACQCSVIRANLYSAASCGIWLGGPRGYEI